MRLAPSYGQPRWLLGNALLQAGQRERAFAELSRAAASDPGLVSQTLNLLWQALSQDADALTRALSLQTPAAQTELARFLLEHGREAEAVAVLRRAVGLSGTERKKFVASLVSAKKFTEAYELWSAGNEGGAPLERAMAVNDGGFESDIHPEDRRRRRQDPRPSDPLAVRQPRVACLQLRVHRRPHDARRLYRRPQTRVHRDAVPDLRTNLARRFLAKARGARTVNY